MADAWGGSWGSAWGVSWGSGAGPTPPVTPAATQLVGGGIPHPGMLHLPHRPRTREDIRKDRARFGIEVAEVISSVAARQAENLVLDEQKRYEELSREITLRGLEFESRHLEALNIERQRLIDQEIGRLLRIKVAEEEAIMMLLVLAACV